MARRFGFTQLATASFNGAIFQGESGSGSYTINSRPCQFIERLVIASGEAKHPADAPVDSKRIRVERSGAHYGGYRLGGPPDRPQEVRKPFMRIGIARVQADRAPDFP